MTRIIFVSLVVIVYLIYAAFKYKDTWKKLRLGQLAGTVLTFIVIISIAGVTLFYGSRYITAAVSSSIGAFIIQFFAVMIIIAAAGLIFMAIVSKITNGIIPLQRQQGYSQTPRRDTKHKS
ncbi:hypothetical protein GCM10028778_01840 [Barrientosiimonas marina]|uniref:Uncharacterized protein n=1 Tax=Lentibacillus kimchii TaxID=1542911 RepID=A0ABW2UNZ4_9BACI